MDETVFAEGSVPPVLTTAIWNWNKQNGYPEVAGYPQGNGKFTPTKTGLTPQSLQDFVGVPLQYYGNPSVPVPQNVITDWIRQAEDSIEQETSILLCQTWVASPPTLSPAATVACGLLVNNPSGVQEIGTDYDLEDNAYDFMFSRAQDEGWMFQILRYRPITSFAWGNSGSPATAGITAVKNTAFIYPLLNQFFRIPPTWNVEDRDYGAIRYVPAANVQMLPLFAMQLAFMGFAENVPGAIWLQYTAGLRPQDYTTRYAFMKRLVLAEAAIMALRSIQGTINLGVERLTTTIDGLQQQRQYPSSGPFGPLINSFTKEKAELLSRAQRLVQGPALSYI